MKCNLATFIRWIDVHCDNPSKNKNKIKNKKKEKTYSVTASKKYCNWMWIVTVCNIAILNIFPNGSLRKATYGFGLWGSELKNKKNLGHEKEDVRLLEECMMC